MESGESRGGRGVDIWYVEKEGSGLTDGQTVEEQGEE